MATVAVALSVMVKSPLVALNSRVANVDEPTAIVSLPPVELNRTVPPLALNTPLLSNDPPTLNTPVGKTALPLASAI